ncbi:MAG: hypothetical protein HC905_32260 [Bacteroidales bacterium]|nr:hypothetical protein [Bacteroidales bacterium]
MELCAETNPAPENGKVNCLKYIYEKDHSGSDSHPNKAANEFIGPLFAEFIVQVIQSQTNIRVNQIDVTGQNNISEISSDKGTLQMVASILPSDASNKEVTWSISEGSDNGSISSTGLLSAIKNGTVTIKATAKDGSGVFGTKIITISGQQIKVTGITVTGSGNASSITTDKGTLQMQASILPSDASNKEVTWSISEGSENGNISSTGLLSAIKNGALTVKATAKDGSGVFGTKTITISGQQIKVNGITVTGSGNASSITTDNGTLQMQASILPSDASNKEVTWSISEGSDNGSISSTGLLSALKNGTITVKATTKDGSGVFGTKTITISGQQIKVISIAVSGSGNASSITTDNGTLQMQASILPSDASNKEVTWSINEGSDNGSISSTGLLSAVKTGH